MPTCPAGHDSATHDYCDTCGLAVDASPTAQLPAASGPAPAAETCAVCGAPRHGRFCEECGHDAALPAPADPPSGPARRVAGPDPVREPPAPVAATGAARVEQATPDRGSGPSGHGGGPPGGTGVWTAVVRADRTWFDEVRRRQGPDVDQVDFPRYCPERRFTLAGTQVAIGRRSRSRGTDPEIDLSGPPLDPGVSAQHALLVAGADGGWDVVDLDSTNGTSVGDSPDPIAAHTPVALADGARIRLGAWTSITVELARPAGQPR